MTRNLLRDRKLDTLILFDESLMYIQSRISLE